MGGQHRPKKIALRVVVGGLENVAGIDGVGKGLGRLGAHYGYLWGIQSLYWREVFLPKTGRETYQAGGFYRFAYQTA